MDWRKWNERQRKKEKRLRTKKKFTTNSYGYVMFEYKHRKKK